MFLAIQHGYYLKAIDCIESAPNVNIRDEDGKTPLIRAILLKDQQKAVGLARALLANGAKISAKDKQGLNALHHCCIKGLPLLVEVLLDALDFDVNARCRKTGNTALHFSAITGNEDVCRKLVKHINRYRLNIDIQNRAGHTALSLAFQFLNDNIAQLLLRHGAIAELSIFREPVKKSSPAKPSNESPKPIRKTLKQDPRKLRNCESKSISRKSSSQSTGSTTTSGESENKEKCHIVASVDVSEVSWREVIPLLWNKYTQQNR